MNNSEILSFGVEEKFRDFSYAKNKLQHLKERKDNLEKKSKEVRERIISQAKDVNSVASEFGKKLAKNLGNYLFRKEYEPHRVRSRSPLYRVSDYGYHLVVYPDLKVRLIDATRSEVGVSLNIEPMYYRPEIVHSAKVNPDKTHGIEGLKKVYENFETALNRYEFSLEELPQRTLEAGGNFWNLVEEN